MPKSKEVKREEALKRQAHYDQLSLQQKKQKLESEGRTHTREYKRLTSKADAA